jgi:acetylglutamate kinase
MTRVLVKLGGGVARGAVDLVHARRAVGDEVVVVHGAGPQIGAELRARGIEVRFVDGRRVTSAAALPVVRAASVAVGAELCSALGPDGLHLVGDEIGLEAVRVPELGFVGTPLACRPAAIEDALDASRIPVVTPLAVGPLNVNADEAAAALAAGIGAERVLFVSDVPGVYLDGSVLPRLRADRAAELLDAGAFEGGIVPKLLAAVQAARLGLRVEIGETAVVA